MARCVWALAPEDITEFIANVQEPHARGWLAAVFHALPHEDLTRVVVTLWALWHARRKAIHEGASFRALSRLTVSWTGFWKTSSSRNRPHDKHVSDQQQGLDGFRRQLGSQRSMLMLQRRKTFRFRRLQQLSVGKMGCSWVHHLWCCMGSPIPRFLKPCL